MTYPTKKLGEVLEISYGKGLPKESRIDSGKYFAYGSNGPVYSTDESLTKGETIVIGRKGTAGALYFINNPCWPIDTTFFAKSKNDTSLKFIYYLLLTKRLPSLAIVTGVPGINRTTLSNIHVQLPPLAIQKQIVGRLDRIAGAQKLNDELIQKTNELFQSLLHKELNPVGKDWEVKKIGDIFKTSSGGTPLKEKMEFYENGKIPWLRSGEVSQGSIFRSELFITEKGLKQSSAKIFPIDTVLVAMYGATAGQIGLLKFKASTNQAICGILPNDKFIPEYLYYFLKTKTKYLIQISTGGAQPNISQTIIKNLKVPSPDLKVQKQIVAKLSAVQDYKKQLLEQKFKLKELFDSVLAKSMKI